MSEDTGNLISQKRKEKKLTQDDLANVGDCSGNRVARFSYPRFNNSRYYYTNSKR